MVGDDKDLSMKFKDINGGATTHNTLLCDVPTIRLKNPEVEAWLDGIHKNYPLGKMDAGFSPPNLVRDPDIIHTPEKAVEVPKESWLDRFDREKPKWGRMKLPAFSVLEGEDPAP